MWEILGFLMILIFIGWTIMVTYNLHILDKKVKDLEHLLDSINNEILKNKTSKTKEESKKEEAS